MSPSCRCPAGFRSEISDKTVHIRWRLTVALRAPAALPNVPPSPPKQALQRDKVRVAYLGQTGCRLTVRRITLPSRTVSATESTAGAVKLSAPDWNRRSSDRYASRRAAKRVGLHVLMAQRLGTPVSRPARAVLRTAHVVTPDRPQRALRLGPPTPTGEAHGRGHLRTPVAQGPAGSRTFGAATGCVASRPTM